VTAKGRCRNKELRGVECCCDPLLPVDNLNNILQKKSDG